MNMSGASYPSGFTPSAVQQRAGFSNELNFQTELEEYSGEIPGEDRWEFTSELFDRYQLAPAPPAYTMASAQEGLSNTGGDQLTYLDSFRWQLCSSQKLGVPNIQVQVAANGDSTQIQNEFQHPSPPQVKAPKCSKRNQIRWRTKTVSFEELREKKRVAARQFRKKQKEHVQHLEDRVLELENKNKELQIQINDLKILNGIPLNIQIVQ